MINKSMERMLAESTCLDVRKIGRVLAGNPDVFILNGFYPGVDYCDAETERWIWSIGKDLATGKVYAAVDGQFYDQKGFECLWLR